MKAVSAVTRTSTMNDYREFRRIHAGLSAAISRAKRRLDSASNRGAEGVRELRWWR